MSASRFSKALFALFAACVVSSAMPAHAEPSAADKETARRLVKSGRAKKKAGDLKAALEDFKAAHSIMSNPITGLDLGKAQIESKLWVEARDTLLTVSRAPTEPGETPASVKAREEAKTLAKELEPKIPQLRLEVRNAAPGVTLSIDDAPVSSGALATPLSLNPGKHVVVAKLDEQEKREELTLDEGGSQKLVLDLATLTPAKKSPQAVKEQPPSAEPSTRTNPLVYIGFGVAGAGVLVGGVTGVMALSKASSVKSDCSDDKCPPSTHDDIDSGRRLGTISNIGFAVAIVGAGVGVYGLLNPIGAEPKEKSPPAVSLFIGVGHVGARGRF